MSFEDKKDEREVLSSNYASLAVKDDVEDMVRKISSLLDEYENAYQTHDSSFEEMHKKSG